MTCPYLPNTPVYKFASGASLFDHFLFLLDQTSATHSSPRSFNNYQQLKFVYISVWVTPRRTGPFTIAAV